MHPVSVFLLVVAAVFLVAILAELVFEKTGVPDVVWLIAVGALLGPVTGAVTRPQLIEIAPYFGALTLVVVLFDGGSELRLGELTRVAGRGTLLALASFAFAVAGLAGASYVASYYGVLPEDWSWWHHLLVGTILGGPSAVVVMPGLSKAGMTGDLPNLVKLESALTDVLCVVATAVCAHVVVVGRAAPGDTGLMLVRAFGLGIGCGVLTGFLALFVLRRLRRSHYGYPLVLSVLLLLFVLVDELDGSAALAILAAAVMVGNAPALSKVVGLARTARLDRGVEHVHDEITFIIKSFFFTCIGAMIGPPWELVAVGAGLGVVLLAVRAPAVWLSTAFGVLGDEERVLIGVIVPRGMAAGVLATLPMQLGVPHTEQLPVLIYGAVVTTILLFSVGFPIAKRRVAAKAAAASVPAEAATVQIPE